MTFPTKPKPISAWSMSRYSDYMQCPAAFKYRYIVKLPTAKHPAAARGITVAEETDKWFKRARRTMPKELKPLESTYKLLHKDKTVESELAWNFTKKWEPCAWNDWDNCWVRMRIDLATTAPTVFRVFDNKTGKYNENNVQKYMLQLDLYAAGASVVKAATKIKEVHVQLLFSDLGIKYPENPKVYTIEQAARQRREWEKRVKPMMSDTTFATRPGYYCRWCPFSHNTIMPNGKPGPCKY